MITAQTHQSEQTGTANTPLQGRPIRTFVLRKGRITEAQKKAYTDYASRWCIPYTVQQLSFSELFANDHPVIIEIGFGMGVATAEIAAQHPESNYIAIEVLENMIADSSIAGFHIFFPDPWQKKKHHKRRLLRRPRTDLLARKLQDNGYLYMVTDWYDYAEDAFAELSATKGLRSKYEGFAPPQPWRPKTKFEQKGLNKAHPITELMFIRDIR